MNNWKIRNNNKMLDARFEFSNYDILREFLDSLAEKAEELKHHPNVSFGKDYASIAIYAKNDELSDIDFSLAKAINNCFDKTK